MTVNSLMQYSAGVGFSPAKAVDDLVIQPREVLTEHETTAITVIASTATTVFASETEETVAPTTESPTGPPPTTLALPQDRFPTGEKVRKLSDQRHEAR